ncbi:MAG: acyl carrier protein [Lachnospiraceae bacterium]|nr:acyl carrier protein [Lachnospiraceae bacterium]
MENMKKHVNKILVQLKKAIEPYLDSSNLISDGILDSLDIMNLIMELEKEFDIEIDPEDVLSENFESVEAIIALIEKCRI